MKKSAQSENENNIYNEGNISATDNAKSENPNMPVDPLPESTRPRKDGPGGE